MQTPPLGANNKLEVFVLEKNGVFGDKQSNLSSRGKRFKVDQ